MMIEEFVDFRVRAGDAVREQREREQARRVESERAGTQRAGSRHHWFRGAASHGQEAVSAAVPEPVGARPAGTPSDAPAPERELAHAAR
ncbi:hypothetical protein [Leifsonia sp. fls2-241-R2A-40a]|uniref:hypothetical protein n=1 Tax=Leifsonia sp. fls2-241-R2A-40a TaxID=3040290 RepID=UPI00254ACF44|nr:hypothetical protein [Leifsonia sp. fls2-241-R2A-40a]